jgi:hypothetical protein
MVSVDEYPFTILVLWPGIFATNLNVVLSMAREELFVIEMLTR